MPGDKNGSSLNFLQAGGTGGGKEGTLGQTDRAANCNVPALPRTPAYCFSKHEDSALPRHAMLFSFHGAGQEQARTGLLRAFFPAYAILLLNALPAPATFPIRLHSMPSTT